MVFCGLMGVNPVFNPVCSKHLVHSKTRVTLGSYSLIKLLLLPHDSVLFHMNNVLLQFIRIVMLL